MLRAIDEFDVGFAGEVWRVAGRSRGRDRRHRGAGGPDRVVRPGRLGQRVLAADGLADVSLSRSVGILGSHHDAGGNVVLLAESDEVRSIVELEGLVLANS